MVQARTTLAEGHAGFEKTSIIESIIIACVFSVSHYKRHYWLSIEPVKYIRQILTWALELLFHYANTPDCTKQSPATCLINTQLPAALEGCCCLPDFHSWRRGHCAEIHHPGRQRKAATTTTTKSVRRDKPLVSSSGSHLVPLAVRIWRGWLSASFLKSSPDSKQ